MAKPFGGGAARHRSKRLTTIGGEFTVPILEVTEYNPS